MIARAPFGRTGHRSSRVIFGAAALWSMSQERADGLLALLDAHGVNHLDTAAAYGGSELRLAPWLRTRRNDFFVATKTGERDRDGARSSLERSLDRLGTDHVDLIQLHNLVEEDEWAVAHGPGGAVEALAQARDEGLTRFIGVTGHGVRIAGMHLRSLQRFDFDSVLLPYNFPLAESPAYRADFESLLEACAARGVAVQTIKSIARRRWTDDVAPRHSWYEPLGVPAVASAVSWVLANPQVFLNTSSDAKLLEATLVAADPPGAAPDDAAMRALVEGEAMQPLFDGAELERI